jgi:uncharacterized membrane protein YkoI
MFPKSRQNLTLLAAVAAAGLGGAAIAGAASNSSGSGSSSSSGSSNGNTTEPVRADEKALTGETAAKVEAAAVAKVSGTVLRVETDDGGVYEAHVRKADGTEVEVKVDKDLKVTAVNEGGPGGHGGRGHGGPGGPSNEKALTGDTAAKVKAAALDKVSGGTVLRVESDNGGVYEAHVRKADGTEVEVKVGKDFKVTAVDEHGPGGHDGTP